VNKQFGDVAFGAINNRCRQREGQTLVECHAKLVKILAGLLRTPCRKMTW